jgi:hypothetical protein
VKAMLDDLSTLPPKRLEKLLERVAHDALPCRVVSVVDGDANEGITVALHVDPRRRRDVLDLARVMQDDSRVGGSADWSLLPPTRRRGQWRLLLRVSLERPVVCTFTVSFDVRPHPNDPLRPTLSLLLAANRLAFAFDARVRPDHPLVWITAPVAREPVLELINLVGL